MPSNRGDEHAQAFARPAPADLPGLRRQVLEIVRRDGYLRFDEPVRLASGALSRDFVDGKKALADGHSLVLACRALWALALDAGAGFDAVGGLTLGADPLSHGIAAVSGSEWFVVRKQSKGRGTDRVIEGAELRAGRRVFLVEDVVSTGGSIREAYDRVRDTGADVVLASALVDRGEAAAAFFDAERVAYRPLLTYRDLGIEPVAGPVAQQQDGA